ncbi:E3 ubiquitin-protein ligase DTX3L [Collichthys lucidus]|uniref:E3 ubiquitin-protein ligase n=1 Tax=Collichthys lucidus TaxID=240159 RepID=A0A4U5UWF7_COLLU|nr:E3 ubiquitin-protein ligase DTX3L [Collichthys lucidus]
MFMDLKVGEKNQAVISCVTAVLCPYIRAATDESLYRLDQLHIKPLVQSRRRDSKQDRREGAGSKTPAGGIRTVTWGPAASLLRIYCDSLDPFRPYHTSASSGSSRSILAVLPNLLMEVIRTRTGPPSVLCAGCHMAGVAKGHVMNSDVKLKVKADSGRTGQVCVQKTDGYYRLQQLCRMSFISDITAIIDEAAYPGRLLNCLRSYNYEKRGSCYKVKGTFEQLEQLSIDLPASHVNHQSSPATRRRIHQQDEQASTHVKLVDVSAVFMAYIERKCEKELDQIRGNMFVLETKPDLKTVQNKPSTVQVIFRTRHESLPVHADFVRQRFITFYQRTASDLQVTSVPVSAYDRDLKNRFPHLLFKSSHNKNEVTVTGPFVHIAKFKEFLLQSTHSSSGSSVSKRPADSPSSRTLGASPAHTNNPEEESCPICMETIINTEKETLPCKHSFCKNCLKQAFGYKPVCPTCGKLYGVLTGTQPDGGKMTVTKSSSSLPGYEKYGTLTIRYYIPNGIQKAMVTPLYTHTYDCSYKQSTVCLQEEHPQPGQQYEGVSRTAYLPDSPEGKEIVKLLKRAFDQRLIFTVGQSTTSGKNNTVTWNDIHHKTSTHGGPTHYGYPDPDYLRRVRDELAFKGIQ